MEEFHRPKRLKLNSFVDVEADCSDYGYDEESGLILCGSDEEFIDDSVMDVDDEYSVHYNPPPPSPMKPMRMRPNYEDLDDSDYGEDSVDFIDEDEDESPPQATMRYFKDGLFEILSTWRDYVNSIDNPLILIDILENQFLVDWGGLQQDLDDDHIYDILAQMYMVRPDVTFLSPQDTVRGLQFLFFDRLTRVFDSLRYFHTRNAISKSQWCRVRSICCLVAERIFMFSRMARGLSRFMACFVPQLKDVSVCDATDEQINLFYYSSTAFGSTILRSSLDCGDEFLQSRLRGESTLFAMNEFVHRNYKHIGDNVLEPLDLPGVYRLIVDRNDKAKCISSVVSDLSTVHDTFGRNANIRIDSDPISRYLKHINTFVFPVYHPHRRAFGFANGVLICDAHLNGGKFIDRFYEWDDDTVSHGLLITHLLVDEDSKPLVYNCDFNHTRFRGSYGRNMIRSESGELEDCGGWQSIPTPTWDSLIRTHYGDAEDFDDILKMFYVLFGRLFFAVRECDNWQKILCITGILNSGSEFITRVIESIIGPHNLGAINGIMERQFGLTSFIGRLIWAVDNMCERTEFDQSDLFSMVAGEAIQVRAKYQVAHVVDWDIPGVMIGPALPRLWTSQEGALERRLCIFEMNKVVDKSMINLSSLKSERSELIPKCLRAYLACLASIEDGTNESFDAMFPNSLKLGARRAVQVSNIFTEFVNSDCLEFDPSFSVPVDQFQRELAKFYRDTYHGESKIDWKESEFQCAFNEKNLTLSSVCHHFSDYSDSNDSRYQQCIIGCRIHCGNSDPRSLVANSAVCMLADSSSSSSSSSSLPVMALQDSEPEPEPELEPEPEPEPDNLTQKSDSELKQIGINVMTQEDCDEFQHTEPDFQFSALHKHSLELLHRMISTSGVEVLSNMLHSFVHFTGEYGMFCANTSSLNKLDVFRGFATRFQCEALSTISFVEKFATYSATLLLLRIYLARNIPELEEQEDKFADIHGCFIAAQNRLDSLREFIIWKLALRHQNHDYENYAYLGRLQFYEQVSISIDGFLSKTRATIDKRFIAVAGVCVHDVAKSHGLTYRFGKVYQPIYNAQGRFVHAYKLYMLFEDFVHNIAVHPMFDTIWCQMLQATDMRSLISSLKTESHYAMPALIRDRSLFAFRNGLYDAKTDSFYDWATVDSQRRSHYACVYHDQDFDYHPDAKGCWEDVAEWSSLIDTTTVDGIFSKQFGDGAPEEHQLQPDDFVQYISQIYAMSGRLVFNVDEDDWHRHLMIIGAAQTGKSVYVQLWREMYQCEDVGVISTQVENMFGLESVYEKLMVVLPDIRKELRLSKEDFIAMVIGTIVSVRCKGKNTRQISWSAPMLSAGNEFPFVGDDRGNIAECILPVCMTTKVTPPNPTLLDECRTQRGNLLLKSVRLYHSFREYVTRIAGGDLFSVLHSSFKKGISRYQSEYQSMESFLRSEEMVFGKHLYIPLTKFVEQYSNFLSRRSGRHVPASRRSDNFLKDHTDVFNRYELIVKECSSLTLETIGNARFNAFFAKRKTGGIIYPMKRLKRSSADYWRVSGLIVFGCNVFDDAIDGLQETVSHMFNNHPPLSSPQVFNFSSSSSSSSSFASPRSVAPCAQSSCLENAQHNLSFFQKKFTSASGGITSQRGLNEVYNGPRSKKRSLAGDDEDTHSLSVEDGDRVAHITESRIPLASNFIATVKTLTEHLRHAHRNDSNALALADQLLDKRTILINLMD